jgi:hypothetical protein
MPQMTTEPETSSPDLESAIAEMRRKRIAAPTDASVVARLGILLLEAGRVEPGLDALECAHYLKPTSPQILYNYGLALERHGDVEAARRRYRAALSLRPEYQRVKERLAELAIAFPEPVRAVSGDEVAPPADDDRPAQSEREPTLGARTAEWEAEEAPGFLALLRSALALWLSQPLLWLLLLAIPNAVAAVVAPRAGGWVSPLVWLLAFSMGAGPTLERMTRQLLHGDALERDSFSLPSWRASLLIGMPLLLMTLAPFCVLLALQVPWEGWLVLSAMLALTLPFHVLDAPAFTLTLIGRLTPVEGLRRALEVAGPRTWLHLGLTCLLAIAVGALVAFMGYAAAESTRGLGFAVVRALEVGALCLVESVWAAGVATCGVDAIAALPLAGQASYEAP